MTKTKTARAAGLISLAFVLAGFAGVSTAEARQLLVEKPALGGEMSGDMGSGKSYDCENRSEVKYDFKQYGLRNIDVSKTHDYYIYRVSGLINAKKLEAAVTRESFSDNGLIGSGSDWVRYVVLYDGCSQRIVKQLQPRAEMAM
jgi:hypothetical protein